MSEKPDEPLVMLVRALAGHDDDPRRIVHINRLADLLAERLQGVADETLGDRVWVDDCVNTLTRLLAHLAGQQVRDRERLDALVVRTAAIEQALMVGNPPQLANLQIFEHKIRSDTYAMAAKSFNPLMDHIFALQQQLQQAHELYNSLLQIILALQEELKRAQQSIVVLQEQAVPVEGSTAVVLQEQAVPVEGSTA